MSALEFRVDGTPAQQGSKTTDPRSGRSFDSSHKTLRPWRKAVTAAAQLEAKMTQAPLLDGPLAVRIRFIYERPKKHYRTGRFAHILRPDAPVYKATAPDLDKLERAILDGITDAKVWTDDARVARLSSEKIWGERAGAEISIDRLQVTR